MFPVFLDHRKSLILRSFHPSSEPARPFTASDRQPTAYQILEVVSSSDAPQPVSPRRLATDPDVDSEFLRRLYGGDVAALEGLYALHSGYVMAIAFRILRAREEAEEVVQDVFWQLWKGKVRYDPGRGRFATWLFTIARSRALDRLRRRRGTTGGDPSQLLAGVAAADDPELDAYAREREARVQSALAELSQEQRTTIELAFYGGLTHSEIATQTGEPLGTVKSRIKRGLSRLRDALGAEERSS